MISKRVSRTQAPPLVELGNLASSTSGCISLGQGAPYYHPPSWIFDNFSTYLEDSTFHRYTPDPGLIELRDRLAGKLQKDNGLVVQPSEIIITPGANQAFFNILSTICDPDDEAILLGPYYFNHKMACEILNVKTKEVALNEDFSLSYSTISNVITDNTKVLVFVNPGNPTGAVHSQEDINILNDIAKEYNIWIIADETYEYFTYNGKKHIPAASTLEHNIISIGSFSKTYGIPGWRLGYYFATQDVVDSSIKVQDTIGICAPNISQNLGMKLLDHRHKLIPNFVSLMEDNYNLVCDLIEDIPWLDNQSSSGAYYLFPSQSTGINSTKLSRQLIKEYGVYIVPGSGFGNSAKHHFRISFANVNQEQLKIAFDRLSTFKS